MTSILISCMPTGITYILSTNIYILAFPDLVISQLEKRKVMHASHITWKLVSLISVRILASFLINVGINFKYM